jgi:hypothetical protein
MGFLAPLMLIGVAALAVPIAIHLIGRRRARVVKFAALDFLFATRRRTARSFRLRERVLLLVRAIACAAIAMALAKPYTSCARKGPQVTRGPQAAVLVIDDSFAAGYRVDGSPWLHGARDEAIRVLRQLGPEAEVAIVRTSENAEHPTELTRDHLRLRDQLLALQPSARPADTTRALARSAQLLATSNHLRRTVYLISLVTGTSLRGERPWGEDGPALVVLEARPAAMPNLAVTSLRFDPEPSAGTRGLAFDAEIANFGDVRTTVEATLAIDERVVARGTIEVPAQGRRIKRFLAQLPPGARGADAVVSLAADDLPADDRRWVRASLRDQIRVLLVNGDPRTVRHDDELFYLEAALRPGDREDSGTKVRKITVEDLAGIEPGARDTARAIDLEEFDVVVLANVPALSAERVAVLAAWMRGGGGILIAPGDRVDPAAYDRTMLPLLPQSLRDPIDTAWGATADDRASRALHLTKWETDHPIFAPFSKTAPELANARFYKIVLLGPTTGSSDRKVLARYTNGGAALVEASAGAGRSLLFTSTLDRDWNDLPIHPGFLPLMQQAIRHLARTGTYRPTTSEHVVGASVALPTADLQKLEVRGPDGIGATFEGDRLTNRSTVRFGRTDKPGIYHVIGTDLTGATRELQRFAINLDPRGSDLAAAPAIALPSSGSGGGSGPAEDSSRRVELWHALAAALLLLLLAEGLLVQR